MTQILEIYKEYKILPQLQLHQLRVAAVAQQICDNSTIEIDAQSIIEACLLHDMGNIIKFDLSRFPEFLEPDGLNYWQKVKDDYMQKYQTKDEHVATVAITAGLGVSKRVQELVSAVGFKQGPDNAVSSDYGRKICAYSDMRVGPYGVMTLEDRLIDGAIRYSGEKFEPGERQDEFSIALRQIEDQIFNHLKIKPENINDESIAPIVRQLKSYQIKN